jgi:transcriptional regulator with XRE-family HTH domain
VQERLIRHIRESLGLTQQEFAASLGISQATVSRWEAGRVSPDVEMRRRIHDLARRDGGMIDAPLFALVRRAPSVMALMDMDMRILALSDTAAKMNRMTPREASGVNYRPYFTPDMETAYEAALQAGFFTGEGLSVDLCSELLTLQGETVHMRGSWHILPRPSTGQPLLVWHGQQISQAEYQSHKAAHGVVRIVNLAEWLEDDMQIGLNQAAPQEAVG